MPGLRQSVQHGEGKITRLHTVSLGKRLVMLFQDGDGIRRQIEDASATELASAVDGLQHGVERGADRRSERQDARDLLDILEQLVGNELLRYRVGFGFSEFGDEAGRPSRGGD